MIRIIRQNKCLEVWKVRGAIQWLTVPSPFLVTGKSTVSFTKFQRVPELCHSSSSRVLRELPAAQPGQGLCGKRGCAVCWRGAQTYSTGEMNQLSRWSPGPQHGWDHMGQVALILLFASWLGQSRGLGDGGEGQKGRSFGSLLTAGASWQRSIFLMYTVINSDLFHKLISNYNPQYMWKLSCWVRETSHIYVPGRQSPMPAQ